MVVRLVNFYLVGLQRAVVLGIPAATAAWVQFLELLERLADVVLYGRQRRDDGGAPETVCDEGEMGEMALEGGVEKQRRSRVAERAPVLVKEVRKFFNDLPAMQIKIC